MQHKVNTTSESTYFQQGAYLSYVWVVQMILVVKVFFFFLVNASHWLFNGLENKWRNHCDRLTLQEEVIYIECIYMYIMTVIHTDVCHQRLRSPHHISLAHIVLITLRKSGDVILVFSITNPIEQSCTPTSPTSPFSSLINIWLQLSDVCGDALIRSKNVEISGHLGRYFGKQWQSNNQTGSGGDPLGNLEPPQLSSTVGCNLHSHH